MAVHADLSGLIGRHIRFDYRPGDTPTGAESGHTVRILGAALHVDHGSGTPHDRVTIVGVVVDNHGTETTFHELLNSPWIGPLAGRAKGSPLVRCDVKIKEVK